jgi:hypothetical protein
VLWNQGVQTDREVLTNRPDMIVKNKDRTCLLIYVAISPYRDVIQNEAEKKLKKNKIKYRNLANVEHKILCHTVITEAMGIAIKRFKKVWKQYQDNIKKNLYKKGAVRGTSHIRNKVLQSET